MSRYDLHSVVISWLGMMVQSCCACHPFDHLRFLSEGAESCGAGGILGIWSYDGQKIARHLFYPCVRHRRE